MEMTQKANITEEQYQKITEFLDDLRSKHLHKLYVSIAGSVLLALPGFATLASLQFSEKVGIKTHFGNIFSDLAFFVWLFSLGAMIVLLLTGYQKTFGPQALINRFKRMEYTCAYITVGQLSGSEGRPPYLMKDAGGTDYYVPLYLDFKQMKPGGPAIGIYMVSGGERFAVSLPSAG